MIYHCPQVIQSGSITPLKDKGSKPLKLLTTTLKGLCHGILP